MNEKYVLIKTNDELIKKEISIEVFSELSNAARILEEFDYIAFFRKQLHKNKRRFF